MIELDYPIKPFLSLSLIKTGLMASFLSDTNHRFFRKLYGLFNDRTFLSIRWRIIQGFKL